MGSRAVGFRVSGGWQEGGVCGGVGEGEYLGKGEEGICSLRTAGARASAEEMYSEKGIHMYVRLTFWFLLHH